MVEIEWLGHACFAIKIKGKTIVIDPHNGRSIGLPPPSVKADIVLITHDHFDHKDGLPLVKKQNTMVIEGPGKKEVHGIEIEGIESYHDEKKGRLRGKVTIYVIKGENISIAHVGDLGTLDVELPYVDILIVPVGGTYTLDAKQARELVRKINPRVVIPMHYKVKGLGLPIDSPEKFINYFENVKQVGHKVSFDKLPEQQEVWVFSPPE